MLRKNKTRTIIIAIVAILFAGAAFGAYRMVKKIYDDSAQDDANQNALYLNPQTDPTALLQISSAAGSAMNPRPTTTAELSPAPAPVSAQTKTYNHKEMRFGIEVPISWTMRSAPDELVIQTPQKSRYSIQMYPAPGADMVSLKASLSALPNLHNVTDTRIVGQNAFAFAVDGIYRRGYAFLLSDRLYYLLGEGIENSLVVQTFKIL